jgi:DNA-binding NtrC family response regulator
VLQERKLHRVGGSQPVTVDFRLLAATNLDLGEEVRAGRFREDLFYRLNVFPVRVPSLRERQGDIPLLANFFRLRFAQENGVRAPEIAPDTMKRLMEYGWPGNVRELENYIERAVIMYSGARSIPFEAPAGDVERSEQNLVDAARRERWTMERLEKEYILDVLQQTDGHRGHAAEILGIDRRTLYRKLKQYARESGRVPALKSDWLHSTGRWIAMMPPTISTSASTTAASLTGEPDRSAPRRRASSEPPCATAAASTISTMCPTSAG